LTSHFGVDLIRAYSKRQDLHDDLARARRQLDQARAGIGTERSISVSSAGRSEREWRVDQRISPVEVDHLVAAFRAGTPQSQLAERYGVSLSSVKRLLRRARQASVAAYT